MFKPEKRNSLRSKRSRASRTKYRAARRSFWHLGKWGENKKVEGGRWPNPTSSSNHKGWNTFETLKPSQTTTNQPSRVPLVITYNPGLCSISTIIQRHFKILSSSPRCNSVFQTTPLVALRRADNLSDILARSKLRTVKQTNVTKGTFRCGKNWRPYKLYLFCHRGNENHSWPYRLQL